MGLLRTFVAIVAVLATSLGMAHAQPIDLCGTLETGILGCMHVRTDANAVYLLTPRPLDRVAGERVRVTGYLNTPCNNFCQLTVNCIQDPFVTNCPVNTCRADFDRSGTISVQDIFSFLAAYFANVTGPSPPGGDFDQNGTVSVGDIFSFLAAYFTGCP
jgi:hypothetical protein